MQTNTENVSTSSGVPVQMVAPQLSLQQGQAANINPQSSVAYSNMMYATSMSMSQASLQPQVQDMQQNMNTNSEAPVQMVLPTLQAQTQNVQTANASQNSSTHPTIMQSTVSVSQPQMQHVQVIQQPLSTPYFQQVYSPQQQMFFPGNVAIQQAGTAAVQSINQTQNISLQMQPRPTGLDPKNSITGQTFQIINSGSKAFPNQTMLTKPVYSSTVPLQSTSQVSNGNQLKQIVSQPQILTTQASGAVYSQPQVYGSFPQLPQGLTWASPNAFQPSATFLAPNSIIIRNQQPSMFIQSPTQAMFLPVNAGAASSPASVYTVLPQRQTPTMVRYKSVAVATQTQVANAEGDKMKLPISRGISRVKYRRGGKILQSIISSPGTYIRPQFQGMVQPVSNEMGQSLSNQIMPVSSLSNDLLMMQNNLVRVEGIAPTLTTTVSVTPVVTPTILNTKISGMLPLTSAETIVTSVNSAVTSTAPIVTSADSAVSSVQAVISSMQPGVSSIQPVVSSMQPVMSSIQPVVSSMQPAMSLMQPVVSSVQSGVSSVQPVVSSMQPVMSLIQPVMSSIQPFVSSTQTAVSSILPAISSTQSIASSTQSIASSTQSIASSTQSLVSSTQSIVSSTHPVVSSTPSVVPSAQPVLSSAQPVMSSALPVIPAAQPVIQAAQPVIPSSQSVTASIQPAAAAPPNQPFIVSNQSFIASNQSFITPNQSFIARNQTFVARNHPFISPVQPIIAPIQPIIGGHCAIRIPTNQSIAPIQPVIASFQPPMTTSQHIVASTQSITTSAQPAVTPTQIVTAYTQSNMITTQHVLASTQSLMTPNQHVVASTQPAVASTPSEPAEHLVETSTSPTPEVPVNASAAYSETVDSSSLSKMSIASGSEQSSDKQKPEKKESDELNLNVTIKAEPIDNFIDASEINEQIQSKDNIEKNSQEFAKVIKGLADKQANEQQKDPNVQINECQVDSRGLSESEINESQMSIGDITEYETVEQNMNLKTVADESEAHLSKIFVNGNDGQLNAATVNENQLSPKKLSSNLSLKSQMNSNENTESKSAEHEVDTGCDESVSLQHQMASKTDIIEKVMPKILTDSLGLLPHTPLEKQRQKAIVRPHILTHVIDGFVIYESSEPFPVSKSALMSPEKGGKSKESDFQISDPNFDLKSDELKISEIKQAEVPKSVEESKNDESRKAELSNTNKPKISELDPNNADLKKDSEPKDPQLEIADSKNPNEPKIAELKSPDNSAKNIRPRRSNIKRIEKAPPATPPPPVVKTPGKRGRKRKIRDGSSIEKQTVNPSVVLRSNQVEIINIDDEPASEEKIEKVTAAVPEIPPSVETPVVEQPKVAENPVGNFTRISPLLWSVQDVCEFVQDCLEGVGNYGEQFKSHEVDGKALLLLQDNHIMTITNNTFGPAIKLMSCIKNLKKRLASGT